MWGWGRREVDLWGGVRGARGRVRGERGGGGVRGILDGCILSLDAKLGGVGGGSLRGANLMAGLMVSYRSNPRFMGIYTFWKEPSSRKSFFLHNLPQIEGNHKL